MRLYLRAVSYFRPDLPLVLCLLVIIFVSSGLGLLIAWPMAILIDSVLAPTPHDADFIRRLFLSPLPETRLGQVIGLAAIGLVLKLTQDVLSTVQAIVANKINYNGLMRVRCDLYRKLQALNLAYHRSVPQGDAIYRLSSDTFACQTILQTLIAAVVATVTLVTMGAVLMSRSVPLTLTALSIAPLLAITNVVFGKRLKQRSLECKEFDSRFTTAVQRSMANIGLVQAFGREDHEFTRFHGSVRETIQAWWRLNWQQMTYNLIVGVLFGVGGAVVFGYGGYLVYRDQFLSPTSGGMTVGDLMVFTSYLALLWTPLCTLTGFGANIQGGVAGAQRVFEVLDRDTTIADSPNALPMPQRPRVLEFQNVNFHYDRDETRPVLREVSVKVLPGQMVAFVGSSGVGKSTLLNLLPRFYDPTGGKILLDAVDIRDVKVKDLRRHVALVLQDSVILPTTIAENIAYGRTTATKEQVRAAAKLAGAADFIEALPDSYDTQITEGGANLSGGQRQRISIARALLTEAPFVVLDEPTSALDPHHELLITRALRGLKGLRTVVIVSHRLGVVADCDQIFVMDGGRIVEQGMHGELLARRSLYYQMARHQLRMDEELSETGQPQADRSAAA
jgi:ATP-binding cassette subfamily B protein